MECIGDNASLLQCMWTDSESDSVEWVPGPGEDEVVPLLGCSDFTTRESCEQRLRESEHQPVYACVWAQEVLYSVSGDSCEEFERAQKCVGADYVRGPDNQDSPPSANHCSPDGPPLYWEDRGAGTLSLLTICSNYYAPLVEDRDFTPCEFGDVTIPLACECGC